MPTGPWIVGELLALLADLAPEGESLGTEAFRTALADFRARLCKPGPIDRALAAECVALCWAYFRRAQAQLAERETEFSDLIRVLSEMVQAIGGDTAFDEQMAHSTERLSRMVDINDLRILKRRLSLEVQTLRRISEEKRARDQAYRVQFASEIDRLQARLAQSMEEASLDQLTRCANRGRFERVLTQWTLSHRNSGRPFVLAMIDLDGFKEINDTCGHPVGDRVLIEVAKILTASVRSSDVVARYGGDEFVVLIDDVPLAVGRDRMLRAMEQLKDLRPDGAPVALTLSVGITEWCTEDEPQEIVERADGALYEAKRSGRNRVEMARRKGRSRLFYNGRPAPRVAS